MKSMIEELWNGNIFPAEICGVGDPEIEDLVRLIERHRERLLGELNREQKDVFEKYADCEDEYACLITARAFRDGFRLAGRLMAEMLAGEQ